MCMENAGGNLHELARMTENQYTLCTALGGALQHKADKVARLNSRLLRNPQREGNPLPDLPGNKDEHLLPRRTCHIDLWNKGVLERLLRHGAKHARCTDHGDAALYAEHGIERPLCQFCPGRDGNRHLCTGILTSRHLGDNASDQLTWSLIDRRLTDRKAHPRLCHHADPLARTEHKSIGIIAQPDRRVDGNAVRDIGIIARELDDLGTDPVLRACDRLDGNRQRRSIQCREGNLLPRLSLQKEKCRLDPCRRARTCRISAAQFCRHTSSPSKTRNLSKKN